jgi:hypothetical protein
MMRRFALQRESRSGWDFRKGQVHPERNFLDADDDWEAARKAAGYLDNDTTFRPGKLIAL